MAIEEVGVKLVADGEAQFTSALNSANQSVQKFGDAAKEAEKKVSDLDKRLESARKTSFNAYARGLQQGAVTGKDFQSMLIGSADKAGLLSTDLARLTKSSGLFSASQFKAAENMRAATLKADELTQAVANGSLTARDAGKQFGAFTTSLGATQGVLASLVTGFGAFMAVGTVAVGVLIKVGQQVKSLADDYMNYAFQVKDFGRIVGATPEEASRLIQVADDVRLSVESMTVAMRSAINKGYRPTVDGLGQMSDAYLAIQDPIERSRFLTETFGRSGLEMAKLMELGSSKIREMGASVQSGLIITQQGIDQAEKYYQTLDQLNDTWTALKMSAGPVVLQLIIEGAEGLSNLFNNAAAYAKALDELNKEHKEGAVSEIQYQNAQAQVYRGTQGNIVAAIKFIEWMNKQNEVVPDATKNLGMYAEANKKVVDSNKETISSLDILAMGQSENATLTAAQWEEYWRLTSVTQSAAYGIDILASSTLSAGSAMTQTAGSLADMGQKTEAAISDMARAAQQAADVNAVEIGLSFKYPNIADQMRNLIKSIDWKAAGGGALETFMQGFAGKVAPLSEEQQKLIAKQVGAVDIALEVKTGNLEKNEGLKQIRELIGGDWTAAQNFLDKVNSVKPADMSQFLADITGLAAPETTQAAAEQTLELSENITGTGTAVSLNQGLLTGWKDTTADLSEAAQEAAAQVGAVNTALKNMPTNIDVAINITTSGGVDIGGEIDPLTGKPKRRKKAAGGPVTGNTMYLVGERGPELFIPNTGGEVIPNNRTMAMLNNVLTLIPMAKGGKIGAGSGRDWEKAHNKAVKKRKKNQKTTGGGGETGSDGEVGDIEAQGSSALEAIRAREEYVWGALKMNVAEYNALVKAGASPEVLAEKKRIIDAQGVEAQMVTKLRTEAELHYNLLKSQQGGTAEGLEQSSIWLQNLINKFKDFFALLSSAVTKDAMDNINPLVSSSPAPLALGLSQIKSEMNKLNLNGFFGNVSQLAHPNNYTNTSTYYNNINVPVTATVGSQSDINRIAYAVAKEIAANVRS